MTRKSPQPYSNPVIRTQSSPRLVVMCALVLFFISSQLVLVSKCVASSLSGCNPDSTRTASSTLNEPLPVVVGVVTPSAWYVDTGLSQNRCPGSTSPFSESRTNQSDPSELRKRIGDKFQPRGSEETVIDKHYAISLKLSDSDVQNHLDTVCTLLKVPGARGYISYWPGKGGSLRYSNYIGAFDDDTLVNSISNLFGVYEIRPILS